MVDLQLVPLLAALRSGEETPAGVVKRVLARIAASDDQAVWISRVPQEQLEARAAALADENPAELPLYAVPFAVKDNIDVAGMPTTVGCPQFAYTPQESATVVRLLEAAGAILVGKTNLDQFATGLVGVRSPYGIPRNPFDPAYVPGGSSSGSAVAVANGLVSFALGTDTAGSGRVPAAFTNIVGLKPTPGLVSTRGIFPACRSLDCASVFGLTVEDAAVVLTVLAAFDARDPYSRRPTVAPVFNPEHLRIGVPTAAGLEFFGNSSYEQLYADAVSRLAAATAPSQIKEIDFTPFSQVAKLLYGGPWVGERRAAVGDFFADQPEALLAVTRDIIASSSTYTAVDVYEAQYRLAELRRQCEATWSQIDLLALPTTGTIYTLSDLEEDPIGPNSNLGYYTNFVNLLDLSALALPAGFTAAGLPAGITLMAPAFADDALLAVGRCYEASLSGNLGATGIARGGGPKESPAATGGPLPAGWMDLAVFGLHLQGQPLAHQLTNVGALHRGPGRTAPRYRMLLLPQGREKPGVVEVNNGGVSIPLELWRLPLTAVGSFLAGIPRPLGLGTVVLEDESTVPGFICEAGPMRDAARDITDYGGWLGYLADRQAAAGG